MYGRVELIIKSIYKADAATSEALELYTFELDVYEFHIFPLFENEMVPTPGYNEA